jgi:hypothetical protein
MFFIAQGQRASRLVMDTHDVERGVLTARVRVAELRSEPCNRYRPESDASVRYTARIADARRTSRKVA